VSEQLSRAVAQEVRRLLDERGMSGRALALAAGINPRSIDRKLAGTSAFDVDDLAAVAPVLGVAASDLLAWAERA
jgi:transcriptional regulator with XRE-family HTH domain